MNLVIFDIDGTLTDTNYVDELCYVQAVSEVLKIPEVDPDWNNYRNVTDQGVAEEMIEKHGYRGDCGEAVVKIKRRFLDLLRQKSEDKACLFRPVKGSGEMLAELERYPETAISLATGGWRESAVFKLSIAGLKTEHLPMATSNDAKSREEIMSISVTRARIANNADSFESTVFVGDGTWDLRVARALGYKFIGVGKGESALRLKAAGAAHIIPDFAEVNKFFCLLETLLKQRLNWDERFKAASKFM